MIAWLDLETTGLDPRTGSILEIAMIVTDDNLNQVGRPFVSLVKPLHLRGVEVMDDFVKNMHTNSKLLEQLYYGVMCPDDFPKLTIRSDLPRLGDVERAAIDWLESVYAPCNCNIPPQEGAGQHAISCNVFKDYKKELKGTPLGGNTVHFDKRWLIDHMSDLEKLFSHRIFDVSTMTEFAKRFAPEVYKNRPGLGPDGKPAPQHRALDDIRNSIVTARYYRDAWTRP